MHITTLCLRKKRPLSRSYWSAIGISSRICPSVRPSVCNAVQCGSHGWCTGLRLYLRVSRRHFQEFLTNHKGHFIALLLCCRWRVEDLFVPSDIFCCRMYRLATKCTAKKQKLLEENAKAHFLLLRTWVNRRRRLWSSCLSGVFVRDFNKPRPTPSDSSVPADHRPKLVTTGLIVRQ